MAEARWSKLRDDTWGVRVEGRVVKPGSIVGVKRADGEISEETIDEIVWSGDGVQLCRVKAKSKDSG